MTSSVRFTFNISEIQKQMNVLNEKLEGAISKTLDYAADLLIEEIKEIAPRKTGNYANSWRKGEKSSNSIKIITDEGTLFLILEYQGSRRHTIKPKKRKALRWVDEKTGIIFFAQSVDHPGFDAIPHIRPALKRIMPLVKDGLYRNLRNEISWLD